MEGSVTEEDGKEVDGLSDMSAVLSVLLDEKEA